ncbi:MAG TPA: cysteine--tRNA ligase [bacterium]|jgi:cysteinyl-tRNA synthetase|nr:cysteine--tRNA ligase [bacterium]HNZ51470.1 cysteine--tRNA ligase [bacterium]HOF79450.1 cysteine--tRNA ligase [bacterium]HOH85279.1 cysteine--tRNA ligase [bacterium]HOQ91826.1 cysteine--tRNA ligase [bacterium]
MTDLFLYNTLSRQLELFRPQQPPVVGLYTCGPTVYNYAHLGNLRAYLFADLLKRVLLYNGYNVRHIMNITDVGHLTDDGDAGDDKMEQGAAREHKTAWEIAEFYTKAFQDNLVALNILPPTTYCRATDYIAEQISLAKTLDNKGYLYKTSDGLYFDTSRVADYNKLSHLPLEQLREGARVDRNPEKRQPTDFAVWKFSPAGQQRQMEWDSPWGKGFPGWHLECSAMSLKLLAGHLDIHCGGIDHINVHHTNEIAQSEAATGQPFFRYWLHNAFLNIVGGKKMAKSADNFLTLAKVVADLKISPLAYRYASLQVHYRKPMEYSPDSLVAANQALYGLYRQVADLGSAIGQVASFFQAQFQQAINNDLNAAQALAVTFAVINSQLTSADKLATILNFDQVLGFNLAKSRQILAVDAAAIPQNILMMFEQRQIARQAGDFSLADNLRQQLLAAGYKIEDSPDGSQLRPV